MSIYKHPTSDIQTQKIGENTKIWQFVVILKNAEIGNNCNICSHCFIENDVKLGNNVTIKCGVFIWDGIYIKDNVFVGPNVTFVNDHIPRSKQYPDKFMTTTINEGASIGANATLLGGLNIGKYALIGAGSVITKNVPDYTLWYGNPAVFKGYVCKCGDQLNDNLICNKCNLTYLNTDKGIIEK